MSCALDEFLALCDDNPDVESEDDDFFKRLARDADKNEIDRKKKESETQIKLNEEFNTLFGQPTVIKPSTSQFHNLSQSSESTSTLETQPSPSSQNLLKNENMQIITDPNSKLRLFKSSLKLFSDEAQSIETTLKERNFGIPFIPLSKVVSQKDKFYTSCVIVKKLAGTRKSGKGNEYSIWEINDLESDENRTLFLFGSSISSELIKYLPIGSIVDIINPSILENSTMIEKETQKSKQPKLSISAPIQLRHIGSSKDFGNCSAKCKNGDNCSATVNKAKCDVCIYHASGELKKMSKKSHWSSKAKNFTELEKIQFAQRMGSEKNYKTFDFSGKEQKMKSILTPKIPSKFMSEKVSLKASDLKPKLGSQSRPLLTSRMELQGSFSTSSVKSRPSNGIDASIVFSKESNPLAHLRPKSEELPKLPKKELDLDPRQTRHLSERDRIILKKLDEEKGGSSELPHMLVGPSAGSKQFLKHLSNTMKVEENCEDTNLFSTSKPNTPFVMNNKILLNMKKALSVVKKSGPIEKKDPNAFCLSKKRKFSSGSSSSSSKFILEIEPPVSETKKNNKKIGVDNIDIESDEFKEILNAQSSHAELAEENKEESYFNKLEKKEAIENKLLSTFSIQTNATMCKECKYVAISQSEFCKQNRHNVRIVKAFKRFFKCKDCGNRTMSLDRLPKRPCNNCKSSSWLAAPVGKERSGPKLDSEKLVLRGDEEMFLGSASAKLFL